MDTHIEYRLLNEKGVQELKEIEKEAKIVQKNSNLLYLPGRVCRHLFSWVIDIPLLVKDTAQYLHNHNEETLEHLKRQAWNTFIARPIELVAALASPMIDDVGYRTLCLKVDYDYYLSEKEQQASQKERDAVIMIQKDTVVIKHDVDDSQRDRSKILKMIKADLEHDLSLKEVKIMISGDSYYSIPRDIVLRASELSEKEFIILSSPLSRDIVPKEILKDPRDITLLARFLFLEPKPKFLSSEEFLLESYLPQLGISRNMNQREV